MVIIKNCTQPPLTPTYSTHETHLPIYLHPPKIMLYLPHSPPPAQNIFCNHPYPPKIISHQAPFIQNDGPYTTTCSHPPKIFSHSLPPTQNNTLNTPNHPKIPHLITTHQKYG